MSVSWIVVDHERKEYIDPHSIDWGARLEQWVNGPLANLLVAVLLYKWKGGKIEFLNDSDGKDPDAYYDRREEYQDVTKDAKMEYERWAVIEQ